jgi:fatty-acid desaturase
MLLYVAACVIAFAFTYGVTIVVTSVGYHRALTHGSVTLHPLARRALLVFGPWLTGFDPKAWVTMHRLHHIHSDTVDDPHSPKNVGFAGIFKAQLDGYAGTQRALLAHDPRTEAVAPELALSWPTRTGKWWAPYIVHTAAGVAIGLTVGWWFAAALIAGLLSHFVQGAIINYFGHKLGGRNFDTPDDSRNNHVAAWLVLGEGLQNNHHRYPASARFSYRWSEIDLGYVVCRALELVGVLRVIETTLIPRPRMALSGS